MDLEHPGEHLHVHVLARERHREQLAAERLEADLSSPAAVSFPSKRFFLLVKIFDSTLYRRHGCFPERSIRCRITGSHPGQ